MALSTNLMPWSPGNDHLAAFCQRLDREVAPGWGNLAKDCWDGLSVCIERTALSEEVILLLENQTLKTFKQLGAYPRAGAHQLIFDFPEEE